VYQVAQEYPHKLTLRAVYYRLIAVHGFPNSLSSYKLLVRWTKNWRTADPWLTEKFVDYGRFPIIPKPPSTSRIEIWMEKYSTLVLLQDIIEKFGVPIQPIHGYASISCLRDALSRAKRRGVELIAYFGDIGPTGLDIERTTRKKMPVKLRKIALTWSQVRRYKLYPRPCKPKDRRSPAYIARYGNRAFDLESLNPKILREITEKQLSKLVPPKHLRKIERERKAEEVVAELIKPLREWTSEALEAGLSREEITRRLGKAMRRLRGKNSEKPRKFSSR
jgi:hypothetical protein